MLPGNIYGLSQREKKYVEKELFLDLKKKYFYSYTHIHAHMYVHVHTHVCACMCTYMHMSTGACGGQKTESPGATGHGYWGLNLGPKSSTCSYVLSRLR